MSVDLSGLGGNRPITEATLRTRLRQLGLISSSDVSSSVATKAYADNAASPTFQSYSANLAGASTDPTAGSGGAEDGRYLQTGELVVVHFHFRWGASASGGSGEYSLNLPVAAATVSSVTRQSVGVAWLRDASATQVFDLLPFLSGASTVKFDYGANNLGSANYPSSTAPGGNGDNLSCVLTYEAA